MTSQTLFQAWWQALSAVPNSSSALDWWAADDGRYSRYERLFRVWSDPTDGVPPPFYKLEKEKHLVPTLWENFALFDPANTVASLYKALGFESKGIATDLAWSCEFNLGHQDRQLDIVMHVRFADRDEVLIGEAKAGKKRFDPKDLDPPNVLARETFKFTSTRRYFLLGDAAIPDDWHRQGYGSLSWAGLCAIQVSLCDTLPENTEVKHLLRRLLNAQFLGHGIVPFNSDGATQIPAIQKDVETIEPTIKTDRCKGFVASALQHVRCLNGLGTDSLPFAYLAEEPKASEIVRHWRPGCGGRAVNEKPYWKLPSRR